MKKTVVLGASVKPDRYAYKATVALMSREIEVVPVGRRTGVIQGVEILTDFPPIKDVDTVTLYIGPSHQGPWTDYIWSLQPKRIIFNPGTENPELRDEAIKRGIEVTDACTLVMLAIDNY
ncbi:MAG: putative CoA-binding protein [Flavobacteriales bacterium]|jgi:predicted CoA-binding protein